jgi:predicted nucleic acid-binding protein
VDTTRTPGALASHLKIRKGVEKLTNPEEAPRREKLRLWLEHDLRDWFGSRILPIGPDVADHWGRLLAQAGRPVPAIDSLLAATALHHDLRLVTRNTATLTTRVWKSSTPGRRRNGYAPYRLNHSRSSGSTQLPCGSGMVGMTCST